MWRQYDWACLDCRQTVESLIQLPAGERPPDAVLWERLELQRCPRCGGVSGAERFRVNLFAQYLADRPFSPLVRGGTFDTAGFKRLPRLPEFKGETGKDFQDFRHTKEYQEAKRERAAVAAQNKAKRERARLIKQGANVDIRHHPLPGDPNIMQ